MPFIVRPYGRFPGHPLMALADLLLLHTPSNAGLCLPPVVEKESPYHYLLALTDSMFYAQTAIARHTGESTGSREEDFFNLLYGFKLAKADFECAASQVSPYAKSADKAITISANAAALSFLQLAELQEQAALDFKSTLDS